MIDRGSGGLSRDYVRIEKLILDGGFKALLKACGLSCFSFEK
jgi:hypothetical protein